MNGAGEPAIFEGERYATDTCPRRPLLDDQELNDLLEVCEVREEKPGLRALDECSAKVMTAMRIVADARARFFEDDMARRTAEAEVKARGNA